MISTIRRHGAGVAILLGLTAFLAAWTWSRSGDPFIDAGKDLYTAQQMSQGRALYGDLCYLFGPLAPSILSVAFQLFGDSVHVERALNLALFIPFLLLLYGLIAGLSDRPTATAGLVIYLLLFAFGHMTALRNYNILTPYTNSATYGFALGILTVVALVSYAREGRWTWALLAGACAGLSFLTKPEMFFASFGTLVGGFLILAYARRDPWQTKLQAAGLAGAGCVLAPSLFLMVLSIWTDRADLWSGTLAGYRMAMDPRLHDMPFQLQSAGMESPWRMFQAAIVWACTYGWLILPALLLALLPAKGKSLQYWIGAAAGIISCACVVYLVDPFDWKDIFVGAPVLIVIAVVLLAWDVYQQRNARSQIEAARLIFAIFSLLMLSRMIFNARVYQYGFVMSAGAMLVIVMGLLSWIPQRLDRLGRSGWILRLSAAGMLAGFVAMQVTMTRNVLAGQTVDLGHGFRANSVNGPLLKAAMAELTERAQPGDTLAAFPSAPWVNFVSRLPNPTPYELLDPLGFIRAGGEDVVLEAYQQAPPTWIMLVHQETREYGGIFFGADFAAGMGEWIHANYERVALFGDEPLKRRAFGIALLRRKADQAEPLSSD